VWGLAHWIWVSDDPVGHNRSVLRTSLYRGHEALLIIVYVRYSYNMTLCPPCTHYQSINKIDNLLIILLSIVVNNVEESELVDTFGGRDDTKPVTELLLFEELLGPTLSSISLCSIYGRFVSL
jgi:hypothetical protein